MKKMNMPGFTAESSLCPSAGHSRSLSVIPAPGNAVSPQTRDDDPDPYFDAYYKAWWEGSLGSGGSSGGWIGGGGSGGTGGSGGGSGGGSYIDPFRDAHRCISKCDLLVKARKSGCDFIDRFSNNSGSKALCYKEAVDKLNLCLTECDKLKPWSPW